MWCTQHLAVPGVKIQTKEHFNMFINSSFAVAAAAAAGA
jgi:hypothetical protein